MVRDFDAFALFGWCGLLRNFYSSCVIDVQCVWTLLVKAGSFNMLRIHVDPFAVSDTYSASQVDCATIGCFSAPVNAGTI